MSDRSTADRPSDRELLARRAIGLIDLTDLADDHSPDGIDELCRRAVEHGTAAVCVWPEFVARCAELVAGTGVEVATVVDFPSGDEPLADVLTMTAQALADGADEIDVVMAYRAFTAGDLDRVRGELSAVRGEVAPPARLKVILETGELAGPDAVAAAAELAIGCGADFVKTSTGKVATGATPDAVEAILDAIAAADRPVGCKPSGGIRSFDDAATYLGLADRVIGPAWASASTFRFGASSLLDELLDVVASGGTDGG